MARAPLRLKIVIAILGGRAKEFIPPISGFNGWSFGGRRLNNYTDKRSQLEANVGWCFTANNAILDPTAAVPLKLKRVKKDGEREDVHLRLSHGDHGTARCSEPGPHRRAVPPAPLDLHER